MLQYTDIPLDEEDFRYTKSFDTSEIDSLECQNFFEEYGFVVVRNVLTKNECQKTLQEMTSIINTTNASSNKTGTKFNIFDSTTFDSWNPKSYGMPSRDPLFTSQLLKNRRNTFIYSTFKSLLKEKNLLVSHDRFAVYLPTKINGGEKWKTLTNLHLDINPWAYLKGDKRMSNIVKKSITYEKLGDFIKENNLVVSNETQQIHLQGVINLVNNVKEDGGFQLIPKFHSEFKNYFETIQREDLPLHANLSNENYEGTCKYAVPSNSPMNDYGQRITSRAGSLIVWDQRCIHGSVCNASERIRVAQFIKYFKRDNLDKERLKKRGEVVKRMIEKSEQNQVLNNENNNDNIVNDIGNIVFFGNEN